MSEKDGAEPAKEGEEIPNGCTVRVTYAYFTFYYISIRCGTTVDDLWEKFRSQLSSEIEKEYTREKYWLYIPFIRDCVNEAGHPSREIAYEQLEEGVLFDRGIRDEDIIYLQRRV